VSLRFGRGSTYNHSAVSSQRNLLPRFILENNELRGPHEGLVLGEQAVFQPCKVELKRGFGNGLYREMVRAKFEEQLVLYFARSLPLA